MKKIIFSLVLVGIVFATPIYAQTANNEALIAQLQAQIQSLMQQIAALISQKNSQSTSQLQINTKYSTNTLFSNISSNMAFVTCSWYSRYGAVLFTKSFNGILAKDTNGHYYINTGREGLVDTQWAGYPIYPTTCNIQFPAGTSLYGGGYSNFTTGSWNSGMSVAILGSGTVDFGQVAITVPNSYVISYAKSNNNYCLTRASIGESIAVLGWPINSTNKTLYGSITGLSSYYDNTNIALLDGMQGSVVVSLDRGCIIGHINSSGQVPDFSSLAYMLGW